MNIYEIDREIAALVDAETGELLDYEAFERLQMEREHKIESMACWYKNLTAAAKGIREEEVALAERRRAVEKKAASLKDYLSRILCGEKFQSARCVVSYRKSMSVSVDNFDAALLWADKNNADIIRHIPAEPDKAKIGALLKIGGDIPGVSLVENMSMSVK